jgi:hypothetical protein
VLASNAGTCTGPLGGAVGFVGRDQTFPRLHLSTGNIMKFCLFLKFKNYATLELDFGHLSYVWAIFYLE